MSLNAKRNCNEMNCSNVLVSVMPSIESVTDPEELLYKDEPTVDNDTTHPHQHSILKHSRTDILYDANDIRSHEDEEEDVDEVQGIFLCSYKFKLAKSFVYV